MLLRALIVLSMASAGLAQTAVQPARPAGSGSQSGKGSMTVNVQPATPLPSKETVDSFLKRMFGHDPTIQYRVLSITRSEAPGMAHIVVQIGGNVHHLHVTPDGEYAIAGEVMPFGAKPFAATQRKLAQAKGPRTGNMTAPRITIVEFSDLQCPHCKNAHPIIQRLLADTPGAQLIFQPFPLSNHDWASKAALMGECVALQRPQSFWTYVNNVFDKQATITAANAAQQLQEIAIASGVDGARAASCATNPATARKVQESIDLGFSVGVGSTPTVFVNGRKVIGINDVPYEQLRKLVEFQAQP